MIIHTISSTYKASLISAFKQYKLYKKAILHARAIVSVLQV